MKQTSETQGISVSAETLELFKRLMVLYQAKNNVLFHKHEEFLVALLKKFEEEVKNYEQQ